MKTKNILLIIFLTLSSIQSFSQSINDYIRFKEGDLYGLIYINGDTIIPAKYDEIDSFCESDGYAVVQLNGKYGFINTMGDEVTPVKYDWAFRFKDGIGYVIENGKGHFIDRGGYIHNKPAYDWEDRDFIGVAKVFIGTVDKNEQPLEGKFGLYNYNTNKEIVPCISDKVINTGEIDYLYPYFTVFENNQINLYDYNGEMLVNDLQNEDWIEYAKVDDEDYFEFDFMLFQIADYYYSEDNYQKAYDVIGENYSEKLEYLESFKKEYNRDILLYPRKYSVKQYTYLYYLIKANIEGENGNYEKAVEYFDLASKSKWLNEYVAIDLFKLNLMYGYLDKAQTYTNRKSFRNNYRKLDFYFQVAHTYLITEYSNQALQYYKKCLDVIGEIDDREVSDSYLGYVYMGMATIYHRNGDVTNAIDYYSKSLSIFEKLDDKEGIAGVYVWLGRLYDEQNNLNKAMEYHKKSLALREEIGFKAGIAESYIHIAGIYKELMGEKLESNNLSTLMNDTLYVKMKTYYLKSYKLAASVNDKSRTANALYLLGSISDIDSALYYDHKSLAIYKNINNKEGVIQCEAELAEIAIEKNNIADLKRYSDEAYSLAKELRFPYLIERAASAMFQRSVYEHNYGEADKYVFEIIEIDNKEVMSNFITMSEREQQKYFENVEADYMLFNSYVLFRKDDNHDLVSQVYNNTVRNKGLMLKSSTAMRNAVLSSNDSVLIKNYTNWIQLKRRIARLNSQGKSSKDLEDRANSLEKQLVSSSQEFSDFSKLQEISWKDVQKGLKEGEVAIEFVHFDYIDFSSNQFQKSTDSVLYCALIVTKTCKYPEMILLFEQKQLEAIIGKFGGNNYNYINKIYGGKNVKTIQESSLYNLIWKPMEGALHGVKKVYISPDGLLHKISFPAIAKEQDVYLCDAYDIEVKSTTGKISSSGSVKTIHESSQPTTAILFGGIEYNTDSTTYKGWTYLEGTKTETQEIDKILKEGNVKVNYYTNSSATENEFKQLASNSNIIHIATHGFFYPDPKDMAKEEEEQEVESGEIVFRGGSRGFGVNSFVENPNPLMRSGLVFAGANDVWSKQTQNDSIDDGVLTAQEVSTIDMRKTELVVMSACETGLGDIKGSEGVYGLQRAFKMAGVDYLIMSLWQVPDKETEEFMASFYKKLISTNNIKQSFAETQKEMRAKYDPYFWAAFVLIE